MFSTPVGLMPVSFLTPSRHSHDMVLFNLGKTPVTLAGIVNFVLIVLVGLVVRKMVSRAIQKRASQQKSPQAKHLMGMFAHFSGYLVLILTALIALENIGIRVTSLEGVLGVVGLGFGIGLQGVAANIIALFVIIFEKSIQVGDLIELDGVLGTVTEIRPRSTTIMSRDNVAIIIPNSHFISNKVINWSHLDQKIRLHLKVGIGMDVGKLPTARKILLETASSHPEVLSDPHPAVWFTEFGESSFHMELVFWVRDGTLRHTVISDLNFALAEKFSESNIELPYPYRTIVLKDGNPLPVSRPGPSFPGSSPASSL
ncbi:MAG: mechanosensitive ion channel family protein [Leptospirales bacterium]